MSSLMGLDFLNFIIGYRYSVPTGQLIIKTFLQHSHYYIMYCCPARDKMFVEKIVIKNLSPVWDDIEKLK